MKNLDWNFPHRLMPKQHSPRTLLIGIFIGIVSCGGGSKTLSVSEQITEVPNEVMAQIARKAVDPQTAASTENFLLNGSFEAGKTAWTDCELGKATTIVNDAQDGTRALRVADGNCFYQSIEITPGADLLLSCYAKVSDSLQSTGQWTGMGLGFSDSKWTTLSESPAAVITSSDYTRYDVRGKTPENAKHVSMWIYSETSSIVDNCVLTLAEIAVAPQTSTDANLLVNPRFEQVSNGMPDNWINHCRGAAVASSVQGYPQLVLDEGACVSQGLSSSTLSAMQGQAVELICNYEFSSNRYAEVIINLDGTDRVRRIDQNSTGSIDFQFTAPESLTTGFVSIYSEGEKDTLKIDECVLQLSDSTDTIPEAEHAASIDVSNGLEGWDYWYQGAPFDYAITVTNTGSQSLTDVSLSSNKIQDCQMDYFHLDAGETRTYICTNTTITNDVFVHTVTATALDEYGQTVTDSDVSRNRNHGELADQTINVTPSSYGANNGDSITFTVEAANSGNSNYSDIHAIDSNIEDCIREFDPPITKGTFKRYTCVANDVATPFTAEFSTTYQSGFNGDGTGWKVKKVEIQPVGTAGIDIRYANGGSGLVSVTYGGAIRVLVENTGAVELSNVLVRNQPFWCNFEFDTLQPREKIYRYCAIPTLSGAEGEIVRSETVVTATTADSSILSDSMPLTVFNRDEINLDVEFGPSFGIQYSTPGEVRTVNLRLTNSGVLTLNRLESIDITTSDIFTGDTQDCQTKFTALTQQPNFSLAPGQVINITCDLTLPTNPGTSYSSSYIQILARYRAELLPELLELTQETALSTFIE